MDYQEILNRFTYDDETEIMNRISKVDKTDYRENKDIINEIVLWKMNRRPQIEAKLIDALYELEFIKTPMEAAESELTERVVELLLCSKGMQLPMASTVLHFYFPEIYPIIDQRAYRELYGEGYPKYTVKVEILVNLYMKYIADCYHYRQERCPEIPFAKIDKVLYQLDKEKGFKVKY
ncbi:MAG: hypothetical protein E7292_12020 [Lachnospiraceae bacterium]|nr:hypothetical protein [Lachnospiraceae bacterium]